MNDHGWEQAIKVSTSLSLCEDHYRISNSRWKPGDARHLKCIHLMKLGEQGDKTMKSAKNSYSYHCGMGKVKVSVTKRDLDLGLYSITSSRLDSFSLIAYYLLVTYSLCNSCSSTWWHSEHQEAVHRYFIKSTFILCNSIEQMDFN